MLKDISFSIRELEDLITTIEGAETNGLGGGFGSTVATATKTKLQAAYDEIREQDELAEFELEFEAKPEEQEE